MIGHLTGKILTKSDTLSVIDCHGVGYEVAHTPHTAEKIHLDSVSLHIHSHVREDGIQLFGFLTLEERNLFRDLIKVNGIGPKMALTLLSGIPQDELIRTLAIKDIKRLQSVPGIGKKTAERLCIELADYASKIQLPIKGASTSQSHGIASELESVLLNLGYQRSEVIRVTQNVISKEKSAPLDLLIKYSLKELSAQSQRRLT